ncbi:hypothetical protein [Brevibacillus laterosporus]|uniref:hypothetical protein n=1 Tax=Brevibacillus laterosporus TaxID=1465 RepID=UPI000E6B6F6D|nr:hypothetical protein [Brevibacillus laterosporus]AYB36832.1 hypothetical protein D5F52_00215 [Brevibacillus laterosporus]MBM7111907.1 hypothetical protein [Brevibacillus laterosporus]
MTNYVTEEQLDLIKENKKTFEQLMKEYHFESADDQEVRSSKIKVDSPEEPQIFLESIISEEGEEICKKRSYSSNIRFIKGILVSIFRIKLSLTYTA